MLKSYYAGNIAFQALLEGPSLLNLCLWFISGTPMPFVAVAAGLLVVGITGFPRSPRSGDGRD